MKSEIFKKANSYISQSLIERLFSSPGAKWENKEYWTLNPLRNDQNIGSFHIKENGRYFDHATGEGGDLINLISERDRITKLEAAEKIIRESGGILPEKKETEAIKKKPDPMVPIPEKDLKKLNSHVKEKFIVEKFGKATDGWEYRKDDKVWMCITRHIDGKKKNDIPYYFGIDNKWHAGNPYFAGKNSKDVDRPLFNIDDICDLPVLVVEGEKCASLKIKGFTLVTWSGGTNQSPKSDWSVLENKDVTIWPDLDEPGRKAAIYIKSVLPHAKILDVWEKFS